MKIRLIVTGGTIDKGYNIQTEATELAETHIREMLDQGRSRADIVIEQPMLVDSSDMTDEQRNQILKSCRVSDETKIVILHGTDTLAKTAKLLGDNITGKTIVLMGAMIPYALSYSDALFNLGGATLAVQALPEGVYITMNGKIFDWHNVVKNRELAQFEEAEVRQA